MPGALAAKLLYPERNVVTVTGDGGFLMNSQELETAVREQVPFVTLVFHDNSYSLIGMKQQGKFGRTSHINFGNPDFVQVRAELRRRRLPRGRRRRAAADPARGPGLRPPGGDRLPRRLHREPAHDGAPRRPDLPDLRGGAWYR